MHILIIPSWYPSHYASVNGTFFRDQAEALTEAGLKVGVIAPIQRSMRQLNFRTFFQNVGQITRDSESGVHVYRKHAWCPPKGGKIGRKLWLSYATKLFQEYVEDHGFPDLIHAHCHIWAGRAAKIINEKYGIPFIVTEHYTGYLTGNIPAWKFMEVPAIARSAAKVLAVSEALARKLEFLIKGISVSVVHNMVNVEYFDKPSQRSSSLPYRFLFVGFLQKKKAVDVLISAFSELVQNGYDVFLEVGGDGPERTMLENMVKEKKISDRVSFLGLLTRENVRKAMWRANAFVLPSYVETFGVVLIEAMATGLPVIANRCGGPEEFVEKSSGLLLEPGDVKGLSDAMLKFVTSANSDYDSKYIREDTLKRFSRKNIAQKLIQTYREVIS